MHFSKAYNRFNPSLDMLGDVRDELDHNSVGVVPEANIFSIISIIADHYMLRNLCHVDLVVTHFIILRKKPYPRVVINSKFKFRNSGNKTGYLEVKWFEDDQFSVRMKVPSLPGVAWNDVYVNFNDTYTFITRALDLFRRLDLTIYESKNDYVHPSKIKYGREE